MSINIDLIELLPFTAGWFATPTSRCSKWPHRGRREATGERLQHSPWRKDRESGSHVCGQHVCGWPCAVLVRAHADYFNFTNVCIRDAEGHDSS